MESALDKLLTPEVVWVVVPFIAILGAFCKKMFDRYLNHQERMAKIEAGMDPDASDA